MLFVCRCLNASVEAILDRPLEDTLVTIDHQSPDICTSFMRLVVRSDAFCNLRIEDTLVEEVLGSWTLSRCVLCKTSVYAISRQCPNEILVGTEMLHDPSAIAILQKSDNFSSVFNVLLPQPAATVKPSQNLSGEHDDSMVNNGNASVLHVHQLASDYLRRQRDDMEERIRRFVEEENQRFDEKRTQVKAQRTLLVRHLLTAAIGQPDVVGVTLPAARSEFHDESLAMSNVRQGNSGSSPYSTVTTTITSRPGEMEQQTSDAMNFGAKTAWNLSVDPALLDDDQLDLQFGQGGAKPKRIRHSGGTGKAPKLVNQGHDSQDTLFTMDDFDVIYAEPQMPSDEGRETDASTNDEDVGTLFGSYKTSALKRSSAVDYDSSSSPSRGCRAMGTSLPVNIPGMTSRIRSYEAWNDEEDTGLLDGGDLAASIHTLALTMQEADAPERLFGERPSRHRYRSRLRHPML